MTIRLYSLGGLSRATTVSRWQSFGLGEGTTDSPLRCLDEDTHRQRVLHAAGRSGESKPTATGHP